MKRTAITCNVEAGQYSPEELEFLKAIERYKRERNRPFPTWCEVLAVLRSIGWRKAEEAQAKK